MYQNIRTIKVGTFNLMNFMLPDKPVYGGTLSFSKDEYRRKSDWVEFMLNQMDADFIGFQELFHRDALVRIIKNNPLYRKARVYMAEETGDQPSVALLSRYPVENIEVFTHFPDDAIVDFNPKGRERVILPFTTFTRPVLKADVRIKDYGLMTIFVVHLKSKREIFYAGEDAQNPVDLARAQSRSLMLRASESVALRSLVAHALEIPDRPVILCGDVNDTGNAVTSRMISGEVPQHRLADDVKRRVWDLLLYHVKDIQARRSYQDFYYTHIHNGMYESLDHIMVSQELVTEYPRNTGRVGLVSVYNDHLVDQTFTQHGQDKCKSDHGVVVCSIELNLDRAAKYMKKCDQGTAADDLEDAEGALNRLDEERFIRRKNQRSIRGDDLNDESNEKPGKTQQSVNPEHNSDEFSVQNSLERWKRNHPESPVRRVNRSRGTSSELGILRENRPQRTSGGVSERKDSTKNRAQRAVDKDEISCTRTRTRENRRGMISENANEALNDTQAGVRGGSPEVGVGAYCREAKICDPAIAPQGATAPAKKNHDSDMPKKLELKDISAVAPKEPEIQNIETDAAPEPRKRRLFRVHRPAIVDVDGDGMNEAIVKSTTVDKKDAPIESRPVSSQNDDLKMTVQSGSARRRTRSRRSPIVDPDDIE